MNNDLENRLNELEIKFTLQDDLIDELNKIVTSQQFTIEKLIKKIKSLKENMDSISIGENIITNEKPPHY